MNTQRSVKWLMLLPVSVVSLSVSPVLAQEVLGPLGEVASVEDIKRLGSDQPGRACGDGPVIDDPCPYIQSLDVTCDVERSHLTATVTSDLPPCTQLRLIADGAFYYDARVWWNQQARTGWRNPMPGLHEVCIEGCDICATASCGCATDADCDDGLFCNGGEVCDPATGECLPAEPPCAESEICDEENDHCLAEQIVFSAEMEQGSQCDIYLAKPDGTGLQNLTADFDQDAKRVAISPDGRHMAFFTASALWVMAADGSGKTVVREGNVWSMVRWYDEDTLVYTWRPVSDCANEIRMIDIDGQNDRLFLPSGCLGQNQWPQFDFSPDRTWIALSAQIGCWSPTTDLYVADVDCLLNDPDNCAECVECFYTDPGDDNVDQWPCWGPDNQTVLFSHQIDPGVFAPTAIVQTTLNSSCQEYDEVVIPPFDPDPHSDMHAERILSDGNLIVYTKFLYPGPATLCVWDGDIGEDVWCSDAYNVIGADCGFLQSAAR